MFKLSAIFGLVGLLVATALIAYAGYAEVLQALDKAGWGLVWTSLFHLVPMFVSIVGWHALTPGQKNRPSLFFFFYLLWIRASINNLMPVARIGGEVVAIRLMVKRGMRKSIAVASTVVETTLSVIGEFLFATLGIGLFVLHVSNTDVALKAVIGLVAFMPLIFGLLLVQKIGFFGLLDKVFSTLFRQKWSLLAGNTKRLDKAVHIMYRRRYRIILCLLSQFFSWALGTGEIWLALYFLGHPLPVWECLMIEALIQASGSAAFFVPGALGVQEAGFILFGRLLGLTPEIAAALAVVRRCRDLLLYLPGLIFWQFQESRWLLAKSKP